MSQLQAYSLSQHTGGRVKSRENVNVPLALEVLGVDLDDLTLGDGGAGERTDESAKRALRFLLPTMVLPIQSRRRDIRCGLLDLSGGHFGDSVCGGGGKV